MDLAYELDFAEQIARTAGHMALDYQKKLTVVFKPDNQGPVTNADIAIDHYLVLELGKQFSGDRIVSEESFSKKDPFIAEGRTWFVDPIDGTANYIANGVDFAVMIGLTLDGIARLGVVYQPQGDNLWRGVFTHQKKYAEKNSSW